MSKMPSKIEAELKERVRKIYGCNDNVAHYLMKSGGSVEFTPKKSETKPKS